MEYLSRHVPVKSVCARSVGQPAQDFPFALDEDLPMGSRESVSTSLYPVHPFVSIDMTG